MPRGSQLDGHYGAKGFLLAPGNLPLWSCGPTSVITQRCFNHYRDTYTQHLNMSGQGRTTLKLTEMYRTRPVNVLGGAGDYKKYHILAALERGIPYYQVLMNT